MLTCKRCNEEFEEDYKFCPYCGEEAPTPKGKKGVGGCLLEAIIGGLLYYAGCCAIWY